MNSDNRGCEAFALAEGVRQQRVGDEGIVLRQRDAEVMVLNEVGARVLELACAKKTMSEITAQLLAEYQVEQSVLEADVARYVDELLACGVVIRRG